MPREQVTIVLNEREPTKARAAEALERALTDVGLTSARVPITKDIEAVLLERSPLFLVLDYLLGDFSTGLDIVQRFQSRAEHARPAVFFLTDEPSVPVAVQAIQKGALDYLEIDHPQSIQKLVRAITAELQKHAGLGDRPLIPPSRSEPNSLDDLVAEAPTSSQAREQLRTLADVGTPLVIIDGPPGSGKSSWARGFAEHRLREGLCRTYDLRFCTDAVEQFTGFNGGPREPRVGADLSLILHHAEEDDGSCLDFFAAHQRALLTPGSGSFVVICTTDVRVAAQWAARCPEARRITIPPLSARTEDIAPLMQRFASDANTLSGDKTKSIDAEAFRWASAQSWPENIRQLRAVTIEAVIRATRIKGRSVVELLDDQHKLWQAEYAPHAASQLHPDTTLTLAHALRLCGHRYRAAAAFMGIPTRALLSRLTSQGGAS
jgi:DNA-binding NtrC family response regulator